MCSRSRAASSARPIFALVLMPRVITLSLFLSFLACLLSSRSGGAKGDDSLWLSRVEGKKEKTSTRETCTLPSNETR